MITTLIIGVPVLILLAASWFSLWTDFLEKVIYTLLILASGFAVWIASSYIILLGFTSDYDRVYPEQTNLRSISSGGTETNGVFFLGSGVVNGSQVYTYIIERQDGGFEMKTVNIEDAVVYEGEYDEPYVENARVYAADKKWTLIHGEAITHFYVPRGSVQEPTYSISTEN